MTYAEQLKDPRWQRKRLEIMSRDNFHCTSCGFDDRTLCVHHKEYIRGFKAWEYPDVLLVTLCDVCHYYEHAEPNDTNLMPNLK